MIWDWYDNNSNKQLTLENPEQTNPLVMILNNIIIPEVEEEQRNITITYYLQKEAGRSSPTQKNAKVDTPTGILES